MHWLREHKNPLLIQIVGTALGGLVLAVCLGLVEYLKPNLRNYLPRSVSILWLLLAFLIGTVFTWLLFGRVFRSKGVVPILLPDETQLEVLQVFPTRAAFETIYPFRNLIAPAGQGSTIRFVAVTLFHLMNKPEIIKQAIARGARVELCLLDPKISSECIRDKVDLDLADITGALNQFRRNFVNWVTDEKPKGSIEIRLHRTSLFDSFGTLEYSANVSFAYWDLSFGRDIDDKRLIVVDLQRGIGKDLANRYQIIWNHAKNTCAFRYENQKIVEYRPDLFP